MSVLISADHKQPLGDELKTFWKNTPLKTKITLWTTFAFVFVLVVGVL